MIAATHIDPDADALLAVWLYDRYVEPIDEIAFVGVRDDDLDRYDAVFDVGGVYDVARRRFDHHMAPLASDTSICAASLVFDYALELRGDAVEHLRDLVRVVVAIDHGRASRETMNAGLGAIIAAARKEARALFDSPIQGSGYVYRIASETFDLINDAARSAYESRRAAQERIALSLRRLDVIVDGDSVMTRAINDEGRWALFFNRNDGAVGVKRPSASDVNVNAVVADAMHRFARVADPETFERMRDEIARWFFHPGGWIGMRGSSKERKEGQPPLPALDDVLAFAHSVDAAICDKEDKEGDR